VKCPVWVVFGVVLSGACQADVGPSATAAESRSPAPVEPAAVEPTDRARQSLEASRTPFPVRNDGTLKAETELMGTHVSINLWLDPQRTPPEGGQAIEQAFAEMRRLEGIMSEWQPDSDVSRFNANAGGAMQALDAELFTVLWRSKQVSERTEGAFDITFHAVGRLWKFESGAQPPKRAEIAKYKGLIDWRKIELDADKHVGRLARASMAVGLGAIAKGYAVDRASAVLVQHGFRNHIVEAGGDTYVSGSKGSKPWLVGVRDPGVSDLEATIGAIRSKDESVVTSGDYERFFEHEGKRYAHIFDPRTAWPLEQTSSPRSVTLVAPNAMDADAYCTAVMVMGPEAGLAFVDQVPELEAVIITRDDRVLVSKGLSERFLRTTTAPLH